MTSQSQKLIMPYSIIRVGDRKHEVFLPNSPGFNSKPKSENKFDDHQNKCRCCFQYFGENSMKIVLNANQRTAFNKLTGIPLLSNEEYSKHFCTKCFSDMKKCQDFIEYARTIQKEFYQFVSVKVPQFKSEPESITVEVGLPEISIHPIDSVKPQETMICSRKCSVKLTRIDLSQFDVDTEYFDEDCLKPSFDDRFDSDDDYFGDGIMDNFANNDSDSDDSFKVEITTAKSPRRSAILPKIYAAEAIPKIILRPTNLSREERTFHCDQCEYKSLFRPAIKKHTLTHRKYKPDYLCAFCGKTLNSANALSHHIKMIHSEDGSNCFPCWVCNMAFESDHKLIQHIRWYHIHEEKKVTCDKCPQTFYTEASMKRHRGLQHFKKIRCKDVKCKQMFADGRSMRRHYEKHHQHEKVRVEENLNQLSFENQTFSLVLVEYPL